ncbi:hypothetical protein AYI68_g1217, partial [Smittium mucronatum]
MIIDAIVALLMLESSLGAPHVPNRCERSTPEHSSPTSLQQAIIDTISNFCAQNPNVDPVCKHHPPVNPLSQPVTDYLSFDAQLQYSISPPNILFFPNNQEPISNPINKRDMYQAPSYENSFFPHNPSLTPRSDSSNQAGASVQGSGSTYFPGNYLGYLVRQSDKKYPSKLPTPSAPFGPPAPQISILPKIPDVSSLPVQGLVVSLTSGTVPQAPSVPQISDLSQVSNLPVQGLSGTV